MKEITKKEEKDLVGRGHSEFEREILWTGKEGKMPKITNILMCKYSEGKRFLIK